MDCDIDGDLGESGSKMGGSGWAAEDMFKKNASEFGVKSDYDSALTGYTVKLEKEHISQESKRRAEILAQQIEQQANYGVHLQHELDENMDEETKFSAVDENAMAKNANKYVPPSRRQPEPTKVNGTPPPNKSRQNSRNNSESERKNSLQKGKGTTPPPPVLAAATTPKDKKDGKKVQQSAASRASPTLTGKKTPTPAAKQASKPAWSQIAAHGAQAPPPTATQAPLKKEADKKAKQIDDMKAFQTNFILPQKEQQGEQKTESKGRKTTPPPGMAPKSTTGPPPGMQAKETPPQPAPPKEEKPAETTPKVIMFSLQSFYM